MKNFKLVAAALVAVVGAAPAFAGGVSSGSGLTASISVVETGDAQSYSWAVNLAPLLTFDAATGNIGIVDSSFAASSLNDSVGGWAWKTQNLVDPVTGAVTGTKSGWRWNSWEHADGSKDAVENSANPWRTTFMLDSVGGNVDPVMTYGFSAKNNTAFTQSYTFMIGESIVPPVNGAYNLYADVAGSLTNGAAGGNVTLTPVNSKLQTLSLSSDGGLTFVNGGVDVGDAATKGPNKGSYTYGSFDAATSGSGAYNFWKIETKFTLTGGNDVATISGFAEITPVPEPEGHAMLLAGLGLLGAIARRRRISV